MSQVLRDICCHVQKLSKQNGAAPLDLQDPLAALRRAGRVLALPGSADGAATTLADWLQQAVNAWRAVWPAPRAAGPTIAA